MVDKSTTDVATRIRRPGPGEPTPARPGEPSAARPGAPVPIAPGLLRIADAARAVGVSPSALRLWERQGLVSPIRTGRERRYGPDDVTRLRSIRRLRAVDGLNAAGIRLTLGDTPPSGAGRGPGVVGARLRARRAAAGMSLREAGARTGLSSSFLSGLERGTTGASVAALVRLANAYGTTVGALLAGSPGVDERRGGSRSATRVVHSHERPTVDAGRGVRIEELATRPTQLQPQLFVLAPGASSNGAYDHGGEEFLFVLAGRLAVWLEFGERHELGPGDALTFPSSLPHRFAALGSDETRVLWVNTPPTF